MVVGTCSAGEAPVVAGNIGGWVVGSSAAAVGIASMAASWVAVGTSAAASWVAAAIGTLAAASWVAAVSSSSLGTSAGTSSAVSRIPCCAWPGPSRLSSSTQA